MASNQPPGTQQPPMSSSAPPTSATADQTSGFNFYQSRYGQRTSKKAIFSFPLANQRYNYCHDVILQMPQIKHLADFGCGNGQLITWVKNIPHLEQILCVDMDNEMLEDQLHHNFQPFLIEAVLGRKASQLPLEILVYNADFTIPHSLFSVECILLVEVIEHMHPADVSKSVNTIFGFHQPELVIITTPNREFNHLLRRAAGVQPDDPAFHAPFRHDDHKFEWSRSEFAAWTAEVCRHFPYEVQIGGVGELPGSEPFGYASQIGVFKRTVPPRSEAQKAELAFEHCDSMMATLSTADEMTNWGHRGAKKYPVRKGRFEIPGRKYAHLDEEPKKMWADFDREDEERERQAKSANQEPGRGVGAEQEDDAQMEPMRT